VEMAAMALRLLEQLDKNEGSSSSNGDLLAGLAGPSGPAQAAPTEIDDAYDVSQLRNIIRMLLDDPTSILQTDAARRRRAMELLPAMDELEAFARTQPSAVTSAIIMPIMQFVQEIVELSSPQDSFGVSAASDRGSGLLSHSVVEKPSKRNHYTPI